MYLFRLRRWNGPLEGRSGRSDVEFAPIEIIELLRHPLLFEAKIFYVTLGIVRNDFLSDGRIPASCRILF